jgi:hypothetical protein
VHGEQLGVAGQVHWAEAVAGASTSTAIAAAANPSSERNVQRL